LARVTPLPVVAPVIVVLEGMARVPAPSSVMVFCAAELEALNAAGSNVMVPPALCDAASASRREQGVLPPAAQFEAVPASSAFVFTTKFGITSRVTDAVAVL